MVEIRVFDWERAISDFWPSKWPIGLKHDSNISIASSLPNDMVQNIAISLDWQMKFVATDQKSTVYWKVKLWPVGQNSMSKITIHQKMSKYETYSSRNQKVKISFWKVKVF